MEGFLDWGSSTSLHAVSHFLRQGSRSYASRRVWFCLFSTFCVLCIYFQARQAIEILVEKPTVVELNYEQVRELSFPNVVVCDLNQEVDVLLQLMQTDSNTGLMVMLMTELSFNILFELVRKQARENATQIDQKYPSLARQYSEYKDLIGDPSVQNFLSLKPTLGELFNQYYDADFIDTNIVGSKQQSGMRLLVPNLVDLVKHCNWREKNCLEASLWKQIVTKSLFCYEFTPPQRVVHLPQERLRLIFDFEKENGLGLMDIGAGMSIQIFLYDPKDTVLTTWDKSYSFDIAPGRSYKVGLSKRTFRDASGFSGCIEEGAPNVLKYFEKGYAQTLCVSECYTESEDAICGCVSYTQTFYNESLLCGPISTIMCPLDPIVVLEHCQAKCKPQCSFTKYDFDISSSQFPNRGFVHNAKVLDVNANLSVEYARASYSELVIEVASFQIQHTTLYAKYEIFSASSAIGGLLGMLLGGSMMTIYELLEMIANNVYRMSWCLMKRPSSTIAPL